MRSRFFRGRRAHLTFASVLVGLALIAAGVVAAQEERPEVRLVVEGGIDGWADPQWPMVLTVRIETDILLVGELLVVQGRELARVEVEVPANGARSYDVVTAPPDDQRAILLRVIPDGAADNDPVASAFFRPRVAANEILVGLVGLSRLEQVLGEARSAVSGVPITPIEVDNPEARLAEGQFHQLGYLVMDRPGSLPAATVSWLEGGGRLITTSAALETMGVEAVSWGNFPGAGTEIDWFGVGEGEVLALDSLSGLDTQLWARLLRPLPLPGARQQDDFMGGPASSLTRAALAVETETPSYPWLPVVVVVYAVVVGPLNLWVLRRRRRLEWAWFTIPVLGLLGVAVFWTVGTGGVNRTFWSHGTVQVAGPDSQTRSGLVAATSRARTLELSFNPDWDVFAQNLDELSGDAVQPTISGAGVYEYDLPSLGWLSVNAFSRGEPVETQVTYSEEGVEMINASSTPVVAWGVHAYPKVALGGSLEPGGAGFLSWERVLDAESWWAVGDALWELEAMRETGDIQHWPGVIGDLGHVAEESGMVDVPFFVFAVIEDSIADVEVDGRGQQVSGLKVVLHPVPADRMGGAGWAFARMVWWDAAARDLDFDGNPAFAEQWILSYRLPTRLSTPPRLVLGGLDPDFWGIRDVPPGMDGEEMSEKGQGWEAWDWNISEFVPVVPDRELDAARFAAPSGEVLLRVSGAGLAIPGPLAAVIMWGDLP